MLNRTNMANLFDEPLDDKLLNKAAGIIAKAVQFTDKDGKKFNQRSEERRVGKEC